MGAGAKSYISITPLLLSTICTVWPLLVAADSAEAIVCLWKESWSKIAAAMSSTCTCPCEPCGAP